MEEFLSTPQGIWTVVCIAVAVAVLFVVVKRFVIRERKHLGEVAAAFTNAGVPEEFTTPISDLQAGDGAAFFGAVIKAAKDLRTTDGWTRLIKGIFAAAQADPGRKAALDTLIADLRAGASDATIATDLTASYAANPLSKVIGQGPVATDLANVSARLQLIKSNPGLSGLLSGLGSLPQDLQTQVASLLDAAHSIGSATTQAAAHVVTAAAPLVAAAVPVAAPAALATGAVAGALQITGSLPPGHVATVTNSTPA